jgi:hypothetical protein
MQKKIQSRIFGAAKLTLAGATLAGFLLFTGGSQKRITSCTKPSSIMGPIVGKPITRATSYAKRVNTAGLVLIGGGTKTVIAGALTATGMTTITIVTIANIHRANSTIMSSSFEAQQRKLCAFPF